MIHIDEPQVKKKYSYINFDCRKGRAIWRCRPSRQQPSSIIRLQELDKRRICKYQEWKSILAEPFRPEFCIQASWLFLILVQGILWRLLALYHSLNQFWLTKSGLSEEIGHIRSNSWVDMHFNQLSANFGKIS